MISTKLTRRNTSELAGRATFSAAAVQHVGNSAEAADHSDSARAEPPGGAGRRQGISEEEQHECRDDPGRSADDDGRERIAIRER